MTPEAVSAISDALRFDRDLAKGEAVDRPRDEYTPAAWLLQCKSELEPVRPPVLADEQCHRADIEIGASMANAFESSRSDKSTAAQAYQRFLQADR